MSSKKQVSIKVLLNFRKMTAETLLSTSTAIYGKMNGNSNFGAPQTLPLPFDLAVLKTANETLSAAATAAVSGGRQATAQRNREKEVVVKFLVQLGKYVEANCNDDMTVFLSSGFTAASSTKTATPPISETIKKIEAGANSGDTKVTLMNFPGAGGYELRCAPIPTGGGTPTAWTSQGTTTIKQPITLTGLTPGTAYVFQARALTKTGWTDWGDPLNRIVV